MKWDAEYWWNISIEDYPDIVTSASSERDMQWVNETFEYTIKSWDTLSEIAYSFWVDVESIMQENKLKDAKKIHKWQKIKIPPVTWIPYTVKKWDILEDIAKKYKTDVKKIIIQNRLKWKELIAWSKIILPDATQYIPPPPPKPKINTNSTTTSKATTKNLNKTSKTVSNKTASNRKKAIKKSSKTTKKWYLWPQLSASGRCTWYHWSVTLQTMRFNQVNTAVDKYKFWSKVSRWRNFYPWHCTLFVASYRKTSWRWNANQWCSNAKRQW